MKLKTTVYIKVPVSESKMSNFKIPNRTIYLQVPNPV